MRRQKRPNDLLRLALISQAPGLAVVAAPSFSRVRGARYTAPRRDRYAFLGRAGGKRWGELPAAPPAGRHTSPPRFITETAADQSDQSSGRPGVVIVAPPSDFLAQLVAISLMYDHVPTCQLDPSDLDGIELTVCRSGLTINGHEVSGILWRAGTGTRNLDPLTTASWMAAASRVHAVNAYDPDAWRRGAGWSVWKDRLGERGVPVRPPYGPDPASPETTSLIACGKVVSGPETEPVAAAAAALEESGVRLATVTTLPNGAVTAVDAQPHSLTSLGARRAAARVADYIAA
ncbi:MAG: hypothetical protein OER12_06100 [Acidimicrobiia bacterium]|nr:hypothetical protein [Acidimicrobiia bacterium]